jgi:hypothetical protein
MWSRSWWKLGMPESFCLLVSSLSNREAQTSVKKMIPHNCWNITMSKAKNFHHSIWTGDKRWFHHFDSATKWQTIGWHHTTLPKKNQLKILSACKTMFPVLWEAKGCILVKCLPQRAAITATHYLHSRSYNVYCVTDIQGGKRSSCNTTKHSPIQM